MDGRLLLNFQGECSVTETVSERIDAVEAANARAMEELLQRLKQQASITAASVLRIESRCEEEAEVCINRSEALIRLIKSPHFFPGFLGAPPAAFSGVIIVLFSFPVLELIFFKDSQ